MAEAKLAPRRENRVNVRLSPEDLAALEELAARTGLDGATQAARMLIRQGLRENVALSKAS